MSTPEPPAVRVYFDFVSPYSYLALTRLHDLGPELRVRWQPRPVVYGVLLDEHGLVGPVETSAKRRYTLYDVQRCAALLGVPLIGPPAHPFRSLEALRTVCALGDRTTDSSSAMDLAVALSRACWGEGRDLTDVAVIRAGVEDLGLDTTDLEERTRAPAVKDRLRRYTDDALERGVFGVPTFELEGELFWGQDRRSHLEARLDGRLDPPDPLTMADLLDRPRGAERRGAPERQTGAHATGTDSTA